MAGGFASVQQDPDRPGVYRAKTTDGQELTLHGQPGEDLFNRVNNPRIGTTTVSRPEEQPTAGGMVESGLASNPLTAPLYLPFKALTSPTKRPEPTDEQIAAVATFVVEQAAAGWPSS